jgi:hypothetical protein
MKNYFFSIVLAFSLFPFSPLDSSSALTSIVTPPDDKKNKTGRDSEESRKHFEPAKKLLLAKGVPFDPEALLLPDWREKIAPSLAQMNEMQTTLRAGDSVKGVLIAETLILPEKVTLTGDTVILAKTLVFEGKSVKITGIGKNVYVFPVEANRHLGTTLEQALKEQGLPAARIPAVNSRTNEKFNFKFVRREDYLQNVYISISVNGQGDDEWRASQTKNKKATTGSIAEYSEQRNGAPGAQGREGDPGVMGVPIDPPTSDNGPDGRCSAAYPQLADGVAGGDGENGTTGDIGGRGGKGEKGGTGGDIYYDIPAQNRDSGYFFESNGGGGGEGGKGGRGGMGGNGQNGGKGGDGKDCLCNMGGAGAGGKGGKGGAGGKGGTGGKGGEGGEGGNGGRIEISYPRGFDPDRIGARALGGHPGSGGERGRGGNAGISGNGGRGGIGATNNNCPVSTSVDGATNTGLAPLGFGEMGEDGNNGTVRGNEGIIIKWQRADGCNQCELTGSYLSGEASYCPATSNVEETGCCSNYEAAECTLGGGVWDDTTCACISPIVIDVLGNAFNLTDAQNGVLFDILNTGSPKRISWTSANSDDSWLALDRNNNGRIDNGRELFGSSTPQPFLSDGETKNGFRALAVYDKTANGGNNDNQIDERDAIFSSLKLWRDTNHNGVSESNELKTLTESGLKTIELDYRESKKQDEHGNWFRFRAKVTDIQGAQMNRWA